MKKIFALVIMLIMFCSVCCADFKDPNPKRWRYEGESGTNRVWVDKDTITFKKVNNYTIANIWVMLLPQGGADKLQQVANWEVNINTRGMKLWTLNYYDEDGHIVKSTNAEGAYMDAIPNTVSEVIYLAARDLYNAMDPKEKKALEKPQKKGTK